MTNAGLQKTSGQIVSIDHTKRTVAVKDKDGVITALTWSAGLDAKMLKNKERFFVTLLHVGDTVDDCHYFAKPADWPQQQGHTGGGGKPYAPRNEKPMIFESVFKSCCDVAEPTDFMGGETYEQKMDRIWAVARKISLEIVKEAGA